MSSLSARRAWIEIDCRVFADVVAESLSARRAWIEISLIRRSFLSVFASLSARRAWIEIRVVHLLTEYNTVALRKESVDRNRVGTLQRITHATVALRKESVDRNNNRHCPMLC